MELLRFAMGITYTPWLALMTLGLEARGREFEIRERCLDLSSSFCIFSFILLFLPTKNHLWSYS